MFQIAQTGFAGSALSVTKLTVDAGRRDPTATPTLDAQSKAQGGVFAPILDLAQPAATGWCELKLDGALLKREATLSSKISKRHASCSDGPNISSSGRIRVRLTDTAQPFSHHTNMAAPERGDWYLREWFAALGKIQRDLVTQLDYPPATANALWHGVQRYRRDHIQDISALLNIQPYELLMAPEDAMGLRRLRSAIAEVASNPAAQPSEPAEPEEQRRAG